MLFSVVITSRGCHKSALQSHCLVTHTLTECQTPRPPPYRPGSQRSEERYKVVFIEYTRELIFQRYGLGCPTHKVGTHGFHECLGARKALRCFPPSHHHGWNTQHTALSARSLDTQTSSSQSVGKDPRGSLCLSLRSARSNRFYLYYLYLSFY